MPSEFKRGTCSWCGDKGVVFRDNGRCEECDSNIFHCGVCNEDNHRDDLCRHIFQDSSLEWNGAGTGWDPSDEVKDSFMKLIGLMPSGFAADLRAAIMSGKFHTWVVAPMIGGGGTLTLYGTMNYGCRWGTDMIEIGESDYAEETADGYRWLVSLYDDKTPKANQITLAWLDAWIDQRDDMIALARLADDGCAHAGA